MNSTTRANGGIVRYAEKVFRRVFMGSNSRKNTVARSITRSPKTNAKMTAFTDNDGVSGAVAAWQSLPILTTLKNLKPLAFWGIGSMMHSIQFERIVSVSRQLVVQAGKPVAGKKCPARKERICERGNLHTTAKVVCEEPGSQMRFFVKYFALRCHHNNRRAKKGKNTMPEFTTTQKNQPIYIHGRQAAVLRNWGNLCDIRRHSTGFLYNPLRVAISEELLETLGDSVILQFTNMDTKDIYSTSVRDFRHMSEPIQFGSYEPQRAVEIARLNHTVDGSSKSKPRRNELVHVDQTPTPEYTQSSLWGGR